MRKAPTSIKVSHHMKAHMKNSDLKQRVNTLSKINQMRRGCDMSFLKKLSDDEIHCIYDPCHNILIENIPMTKNTKFKLQKKLIPIKNEIRKIRNSQISVKTKRRLLSIPPVGHGILSAIASVVLPTLISLLSPK